MRYIAFLFLVSSSLLTNAQKNAFKITFEVPQMANQTLFIAYHYSNKQYISDTLAFDNKGKATFQGEAALHHGVYLAVFPKLGNKYFEFLVKDQFFGIQLADTNKLNQPIFINSEDNTLFYADMKKMGDLRTQTQALEAKAKNAQNETEKTAIQEQINTVSKNYTNYRKELMEKNKDFFYTDLLGMMREIEIPEAPKNEQGEIDKNFQFQYFRQHYWDFVDFTEEGIIRSPIFPNKFDDYFEKYTVRSQDSLIAASDVVLQKALANDNVFQYALVTLVNKYANSKIMGDDAVYVHLVLNYYATEKAWWADSTTVAKMVDRAKSLEPILIGKPSPMLTLRDTTVKSTVSLYNIKNDFTILYIWDPECGHCKKATPALGDFYKKHKNDGIEVYAITTSNIEELDKWKDFIKKHDLNWINVGDLYHQTNFRKVYDVTSTPQVFVLDKNKKIIAKRLGVEQLENFFHNYLKMKEDPRYSDFILEENPVPLVDEDEDHSGHNH